MHWNILREFFVLRNTTDYKKDKGMRGILTPLSFWLPFIWAMEKYIYETYHFIFSSSHHPTLWWRLKNQSVLYVSVMVHKWKKQWRKPYFQWHRTNTNTAVFGGTMPARTWTYNFFVLRYSNNEMVDFSC